MDENKATPSQPAQRGRGVGSVRRLFLTWCPAVIIGLWIAARRGVPGLLLTLVLILSLLWLLLWTLADMRSKVSGFNLLFVWLIWVLLTSPLFEVLFSEFGPGWLGEFYMLPAVVLSLVVALVLAWMRGYVMRRLENHGPS